jgi:endonuclease VIII
VPEGDTVHRTARRLNDALAGRMLTQTDFRVPALATVDLAGRSITDVVARGKHILIRLDDGHTIHSHLRMDGAWRTVAPSAARRATSAHEIRAVLATADVVALGRRVHDLSVVATADEHRLVGHLGPDLLGADWDEAEALRRIAAQPERTIGEALLDQRNLAGLGTVYRAETLFVSGVNPWLRVRDVAGLADVVRRARKLLVAGRDSGRPPTNFVYGRAPRPCPRCGTAVRSAMQGEPPNERITYWCPHCQPAVPEHPAAP